MNANTSLWKCVLHIRFCLYIYTHKKSIYFLWLVSTFAHNPFLCLYIRYKYKNIFSCYLFSIQLSFFCIWLLGWLKCVPIDLFWLISSLNYFTHKQFLVHSIHTNFDSNLVDDRLPSKKHISLVRVQQNNKINVEENRKKIVYRIKQKTKNNLIRCFY